MSMNAPRRRLSPKEFCDETGTPMGHASYHFRELYKSGCIELVDTAPRRGATEHWYEPATTALAWTKEWERLGTHIKQTFSASVLAAYVEVVGKAIDSGTFEAQPDSHLSWDTLRLDQKAWSELAVILDETLEQALKLGKEAAKRITEDNPEVLTTFLLSAFESPPRKSRR
jgi:hypothetical protein